MRTAFVSTSRIVTVAPLMGAPLASATVPVTEPVIPWQNKFGSHAKARISNRLAKRTEQQTDLFARGIPVFVICCGISKNGTFITSPFQVLPGIRIYPGVRPACSPDYTEY